MQASIQRLLLLGLFVAAFTQATRADEDVFLTGVPTYDWQYGCFGTACGNLIGYWDRHGFPDFYTGPVNGGLAPIRNTNIMAGIRSMWASQAGFAGRPAGVYGHVDDYYATYASTATDRYILSNRTEHVADCIGDFIGLNQRRWTNMNDECDGNIDGYCFVYWATNGTKRVNFDPPPQGTNQVKDLPSGLREWTRFRGYEADCFSQLVSFNPKCPAGQGMTFEDVKAEINAGYPVLAFLQSYSANYRTVGGVKVNPEIHGMLIYGYQHYDGFGTNVYVRDSWGDTDTTRNWSSISWVSGSILPVRGMIGYHPRPRMRSISVTGDNVTVTWDGPSSELWDDIALTATPLHFYQLERASALNPNDFQPVGSPTSDKTITIQDCCAGTAFYRVRLLP